MPCSPFRSPPDPRPPFGPAEKNRRGLTISQFSAPLAATSALWYTRARMVVRMRATRAHRDNRRSHHALGTTRLSTCECGAKHERHTACQACGKYRGKQVIDVVARTERAQARTKRKNAMRRELGKDISTAPEENQAKKEKATKEKKTKATKDAE